MNIEIHDYQKEALIEAITFYIDVFGNDWRQQSDVEILKIFLKRLDMDMEELYYNSATNFKNNTRNRKI